MKFTIITHAEHKLKQDYIYAYEPYVKEMNLWLKFVDEVEIVAPVSTKEISKIDTRYKCHSERSEGSVTKKAEMLNQVKHDGMVVALPCNDEIKCHSECNEESVNRNIRCKSINLNKIPSFNITSTKNSLNALFKIPSILWEIYKAMQGADHIHLRCPGNIGLLGCLVQVLFPSKPKTVKYAGNWDPKSKQPLSYKFQKWIVSNTFLSKNCKVLVYGNWPNQSKNIIPFFTASYSEKEIEEVEIKTLRHCGSNCHSVLDTESLESEQQISNRVGNDEFGRHSVLNTVSLGSDDEMLKQVQHDESERYTQLDKTARHPRLDLGSHELEQKKQISNRVGNDEKKNLDKSVTERSRSEIYGTLNPIKFLFVGGFTKGKQPLLSVKVVHELFKKSYKVTLEMYGDGLEKNYVENYIKEHNLEKIIKLHGNQPKGIVKEAYQQAHFLVFISKSEGWPKVVAEAMFWGCVPISSNVSCVSSMLGDGERGSIVNPAIEEIVEEITSYFKSPTVYQQKAKKAMDWSRTYTLEKFEREIGKLLKSFP
ncbi:Glycosyl transferases group 1 [Lutibacter oricola]|uniref:Glycosyl transferases group 1 n=1 Tax=Lutibacter oricola TaxID=762486 RepID=A0A1H2X1J3_9FLAO|nr:glycosyltransferase [Lutibacter oricola]SDW86648.1 Glycosyl transferases group 1 [Lutibacter oricola]